MDPEPRHRYDAGRLWAGGVATAIVAALVAILGILVARGILDVAVLAPKGEGVWGNASTVTYALVAAACALLATGLLQLLLVSTPRAGQFFGWIMVLLTLIAVVMPLSLSVDRASTIFTGILNLLIGLVITLLLNSVVTSAARLAPEPRTPRDSTAETVQWRQEPWSR
ncbi:DUF6069 family protein [Actinophytocola sp.]|uniref:DUF6069 family protein n=1 Tax=Actinophytocola sp. TaxID=1872138 RepID=UPI00389AC5DA